MTKKPNYKLRIMFFPILALFFLLTCTIIAASAFGYSFGYENGKMLVERKGMILLATRPGDAIVYVDGEKYKSNSPIIHLLPLKINKLTLGEHSIRVEKEGYEKWEGTFNVESGIVAWGNYLLLVPQKREASPYNLPGDVTQTVKSSDGSKILVSSQDKTTKIYTISEITIQSKGVKRIFEAKLPDTEERKVIGYSNQKNRYILEKKVGTKKTYTVYEAAENGKSWKLDDLYKTTFDYYYFNPRNENDIYAASDQNLYSLDYTGKKMSAVLASRVIGVYPDEGILFFVQNVEGNYGLWRLEQNNSKTNIIKTLPVSTAYQIKYLADIDSYAILSKKDKELFVYTIESGHSVLKRISEKVDYFTASPKSKFIGIAKEGTFLCYETERKIFHSTFTKRKISSIAWLSDEYNLLYIENGKLNLINYNGYYDKYLFDADKSIPVYTAPSANNFFFGTENSTKETLDLSSSSL